MRFPASSFALPLMGVLVLSGCAVPLAPTEDAADQHQDFFSNEEREAIRERERQRRRAAGGQVSEPQHGGGGD